MTANQHAHPSNLHTRLRDSRLAMFGLNRHPRVYELAFGWLGEPLHRQVAADAAHAEGLFPGDLVVDIGTGPGRVPRLLHQLRPDLDVEGVDVSAEMIERAQATAAGEGPTSSGSGTLSYRVADVADLPYPDRSVALVISSLSLHHWPDPATGLAEIRRVLRPGGRAWIYDATTQLTTALQLPTRPGHLDRQGRAARIEPLFGMAGPHGRVRSHLLNRWMGRLELK